MLGSQPLTGGVDVVVYNARFACSHCVTAAVGGDAGVAKLLLRNGASIDQKDKDGKTALMIATVNGHYDLVETLLENKADVTIVNEVRVSTACAVCWVNVCVTVIMCGQSSNTTDCRLKNVRRLHVPFVRSSFSVW